MKYILETAISEAKLMFPGIDPDKLIRVCKHFTDYMNGDIKKDFELLKDEENKKIFNRLMFGARMES